MNEIWLDKFEDYLQNKMTAGEKQEFEAELASDKEMQEAFSLFKAIETDMRYLSDTENEANKLKTALEGLNKKYIQTGEGRATKTISIFSGNRKLFYTGIAAAFVLIVVSYAIFLGTGPAHLNQRATEYYATNLQTLGQTMGNGQDSLQLAISAYNEKEYDLAQIYFVELLDRHPTDAEVLKNLGLTHLAKEEYQQALSYFEQLSQRKDLLNNPGLFYQALTLLMRDEQGDLERAKSKLKEVVATQSEGNQKASEWLAEIE